MKEEIKSLQYKTKANDVDEKGIVTVAVNGIGVLDSQNDISMPGSFTKTLQEGMKQRIKWLFNHDPKMQLGVPINGEEKDGNVVMTGALNLDLQLGRDVLAMYKQNLEYGRTMKHSVAVKAMKRDENDRRKVLEWQMIEYSTLAAWGSNPQTHLIDIKSATSDQVKQAIDFISSAFHGDCYGFSEQTLKNYDMQLDLMLKALNGANIVTCPWCGEQFDYNSQPEITFEQQVLDYAASYTRWLTDDIVRDEIGKLAPDIRNGVLSVIDAVKSANNGEVTEKAVQDFISYVRCPHCYGRVYRTNTMIQNPEPDNVDDDEPSEDTQGKASCHGDKKKAADSTSFWDKMNDCFIK